MKTNNTEFAFEQIEEVTGLIMASTTTSVIGIPGMGISIFLKHLATLPLGKSYYIDVFGLPHLTTHELFSSILAKLGVTVDPRLSEEKIISLCKIKIEELQKKEERIIFYFGGFDQLKKSFNHKFFHHLRSLRNVNQNKVIFVFGVCRRIETLLTKDMIDTDLTLLSSIYYLKPFNANDMTYLNRKYGPITTTENLHEALRLSGGHFQFLQLLLRSERISDPTNDPFIKLALENIYLHLTHAQKKILTRLSQTNEYPKPDNYLENVGVIKNIDGKITIFSPLLEQFFAKKHSKKLPAKEALLFKTLKANKGQMVTKKTLFETIWGKDDENATDWALDALIYRLRKNPTFSTRGYVIENYKKIGYSLVKG